MSRLAPIAHTPESNEAHGCAGIERHQATRCFHATESGGEHTGHFESLKERAGVPCAGSQLHSAQDEL